MCQKPTQRAVLTRKPEEGVRPSTGSVLRTHRAGGAGGAVLLLRGVLLLLREGGHGREQGGPRAGVGEDEGDLRGAGGHRGLLAAWVGVCRCRTLRR